jgi:hypothetical protein
MHTLLTRARALCLLLALLGGGFGLPLYDAVTYHARVRPSTPESPRLGNSSLIPSVSSQSHAATCALGLITMAGRGTPALGAGLLLAMATVESPPLVSPPSPPELIRPSTTRSRAPPAVTA